MTNFFCHIAPSREGENATRANETKQKNACNLAAQEWLHSTLVRFSLYEASLSETGEATQVARNTAQAVRRSAV